MRTMLPISGVSPHQRSSGASCTHSRCALLKFFVLLHAPVIVCLRTRVTGSLQTYAELNSCKKNDVTRDSDHTNRNDCNIMRDLSCSQCLTNMCTWCYVASCDLARLTSRICSDKLEHLTQYYQHLQSATHAFGKYKQAINKQPV